MRFLRPDNGLMLGFEAQLLASQLEQGYDLYGYLEDDLVIQDPQFSRNWDGFSR